MCRNIKRLRQPGRAPSDEELTNAALQFVRKISGFHAPSELNKEVFEKAVTEIASASRKMFGTLHVHARHVHPLENHSHKAHFHS